MTDRARLERRINDLARIGGSRGAVTRLGLSAEEEQARQLVASWCREHAAAIRRDPAGNLTIRFAGGNADDPVVLVGSHLDSVPNGGRFDGALGVCCAVEAVISLRERGALFARPIEVVAWADEEGARFGITLFGSAAAFGKLPARAAERRDVAGVSIADALRALGESGDPTSAGRDPRGIRAYLELHIEQGPRLERAALPLGVVSDIVGIYHGRVTVTGRQDHAGATVMGSRKDALVAASRLIGEVERIASSAADAVGTVGEISVRPGAKNVVPGECTFSLDIRAPREATIEDMLRIFDGAMRDLKRRTGVETRVETLHRIPVTPLDPGLRDVIARATATVGVDAPSLISGAGHDAQNPSASGVPTGMIFVRSTGGSHTPTEYADIADATLGTAALEHAIAELAGA